MMLMILMILMMIPEEQVSHLFFQETKLFLERLVSCQKFRNNFKEPRTYIS